MNSRMKVLLIAIVAIAPFNASQSGEYKIGEITIENAWSRATPGKSKTGAGFLTIRNSGEEADVLIGGSSPVADRIEVHETTMSDGVMRMHHLDQGIDVPSGETVELKPGGYHIMFMGITEPFKKGDEIPLTVRFKNAGEVELKLDVQQIGAKKMQINHTHGQEQ